MSSIDSQILRMAGKVSQEAIKIEYKGDSLAQKQSEFDSEVNEYMESKFASLKEYFADIAIISK